MIKIEPGKNRVQWTDDGGSHHVGRVLFIQGLPMLTTHMCCRAVRLDYDQGDVIVPRELLRPYPDATIPEPVNQGDVR